MLGRVQNSMNANRSTRNLLRLALTVPISHTGLMTPIAGKLW
jgi:hypothetical protein